MTWDGQKPEPHRVHLGVGLSSQQMPSVSLGESMLDWVWLANSFLHRDATDCHTSILGSLDILVHISRAFLERLALEYHFAIQFYFPFHAKHLSG